MVKDGIIAALAAVLVIICVPWFDGCTAGERLGAFMGIAMPLLFFCLFLDEQFHKWRKARERRRQLARRLQLWREGVFETAGRRGRLWWRN